MEKAACGREVLNFNSDWGFYLGDLENAQDPDFDDSEFASVTLPHTMQLAKKHCPGANGVYQGVGWYRRYFTLDESYADKKIQLQFEGVMIRQRRVPERGKDLYQERRICWIYSRHHR